MRAGALRHRLTIQETIEGKDDRNTVTVTGWQDIATVWAAVEPLRGREYFQMQNTQSELTVRVRIRYLPGVAGAMRVIYGDRIFNIQSVIDVDERRREMELMCTEGET